MRSVHSERTLGGRKEFRGVSAKVQRAFPDFTQFAQPTPHSQSLQVQGPFLTELLLHPWQQGGFSEKEKLEKEREKEKQGTAKTARSSIKHFTDFLSDQMMYMVLTSL